SSRSRIQEPGTGAGYRSSGIFSCPCTLLLLLFLSVISSRSLLNSSLCAAHSITHSGGFYVSTTPVLYLPAADPDARWLPRSANCTASNETRRPDALSQRQRSADFAGRQMGCLCCRHSRCQGRQSKLPHLAGEYRRQQRSSNHFQQ